MKGVKWNGCLSVPKHIHGGGPQGATLGLLEYLSQSNDNADCVEKETGLNLWMIYLSWRL